MLKLFLIKKLLKQQKSTKKTLFDNPYDNPFYNKRSYVRYPIDYKYIKLIKESNICVIKDISFKGFNAIVSDRVYEYLKINNIYSAKIKYCKESYAIQMRVVRKSKGNIVGFEIFNADNKVLNFLKRLLYPLEIAQSMHEIDTNFVKDNTYNMRWFHANDDIDMFLWTDSSNRLVKWYFKTAVSYLEWSIDSGLESGLLQVENNLRGFIKSSVVLSPEYKKQDSKLNIRLKTFVQDVVLAMQLDVKEQLINTLNTKG